MRHLKGMYCSGRHQCPSCGGYVLHVPLPAQVRSEDPLRVRDASFGSRIAVFGDPRQLEWMEGVTGEMESGWTLARSGTFSYNSRRKAFARGSWSRGGAGVYNRLAAYGPFASRSISGGVQFRLNALLNLGGFSAFRVVFGSNPVDLYVRRDDDNDLELAHATPISGRFA